MTKKRSWKLSGMWLWMALVMLAAGPQIHAAASSGAPFSASNVGNSDIHPNLAAAIAADGIVSPGLCRIKTDMELPWVGTLPVNFHSRTRLPTYSHIPGGITPATVRLYGGVGNVQLTPAWIDFVQRINGRNTQIINYLFHTDSGWQNSSTYGRVEELAFENQLVNVLRVSGNKAYIETFHVDELQPIGVQVPPSKDPRIQEFTIVTLEDQIIYTPKGHAFTLLMARRGEVLWIPTNYLACPGRLPKSVLVSTYPSSLNIRLGPAVTAERIGAYGPGTAITILEIAKDTSGNVWGKTDLGWVALLYNAQYMTDWAVR